MMTSCFIVGFFALAFVYTLVCQFAGPQTTARLVSWDFGGIIPYYRVFDKPVKNLELYYRCSPERPWARFPEHRVARLRHLFWNPEGHRHKLLWSHMRTISDCRHSGVAVHPYSLCSHGLFQILVSETPCSSYCEYRVEEVGTVLFHGVYSFGVAV